MISSQTKTERDNRATRFNEIRDQKGFSIKQVARLMGIPYTRIERVCSGTIGLSLNMLLRARAVLSNQESDYVMFGDPKEAPEPKPQPKVTKYLESDFTETEHEIIKLLRQMPKLEKTILISLQNKARLELGFNDFMVT